jgi:hypothetical protein
MPKRIVIKLSLCTFLMLAITGPVLAHHSFAGYDMKKSLTAQATIKEFRWGAPHSSAVFIIKGSDGKPENITVAAAAPTSFVKQGFKPKDFRVGDKVEIMWHPTRAGNPGGIIAQIKLPDGRTFKDTESQTLNTGVAADAAAPPQ